MPRLPGADQLGEAPSGRSGRTIAGIDLQGEGRGIARAGAGLASMGEDLQRIEAARRKENDALDLARAEAYATSALTETERSFDSDPDFATYGKRFDEGANKALKDAGGLIRNPRVRELWALKKSEEVIRARDRVLTRGAGLEKERRTVDYDEALRVHSNVLADPSAPEEARRIARANLENGIRMGEGVGLYTPSQAAERKEKLVRGAVVNREVLRAETDPDSVLRETSLAGRIVGAESRGDPDARPIDPETGKPLSSALGAGQFIESTWLDVIAKHRPDLAKGKTREEILALRTDPDLSRAMVEAHAADNAEALSAAGLDPSDGNIYLAHFAGIDGAQKLLAAHPNTSAEKILGPEAVAANKFLKGKTAGELIAWAKGKVGDNSVYPDLTPEERFKVRETALRAHDARETAEAKARTEYAAAQENDLKTRILDGSAGLAEVEEARADWLTDPDKVVELRSFVEKAQGDTVAAQRVLSGERLNPFSPDDRKAADAAFVALTRGEAEPLEALETIYRSSGILPPQAVQGLRGGMVSSDPETAEASLQLASSIMAGNPNAFAGYDGGADIAKNATAFQHFVERGLTSDQAARRVVEMASPEYQARVKGSDKEAADFVKTLSTDTVSDVFELAPWLGSNADIGFTYEQKTAIMADFIEIAEERFRETGDADLARAYAKKEMDRVYGVTEFDGRRVFMKYPPEKAPAYPMVRSAETGEPSRDYIYRQAAEAVKGETGEDIKPEDIVLTHIPNVTSRDWIAGRPPRYQISYFREENGQRFLEVIPGRGFSADPAAAQKAFEEAEPKRRREWEARAARAREIERGGGNDIIPNPVKSARAAVESARKGPLGAPGRAVRRRTTERESDRYRREGN